MATNAERQRAYRARRKYEDGVLTVSGLCHERQRPGVLQLLKLLASNPNLEVALCRDTVSGKLVKV